MTVPAIPRKKLIEVSIPLEAINAASAREKSIRHGQTEATKGFLELEAHRQLTALRSALATHRIRQLLNSDLAQPARAA